MTPEQAARLTPGTPVWISGFNLEDRLPTWEVFPAVFDHLFHSPWLEENAAGVYERGHTAEDLFTAKLDELHGAQLDALHWVGERLAEYRRKGDEAADRLTGEIMAARRGAGDDREGEVTR